MAEIEKLLFDFVELYNEINVDMYSEKSKECILNFAKDYCEIIEKNIDYLSILDKEFAKDPQLYILVLSALFAISKNVVLLDKVEELLLLDEIPIEVSLKLLAQVNISRFSNGFSAPEYNHSRKMHSYLLQRLKAELGNIGEYIPYEQRNHNLIILETDTLLSDYHAPTKMVLDIYKMLKYEMGYEVLLIVDILKNDDENMKNYWTFPYTICYFSALNEEFVREYDGIDIYGYQQVIKENNLSAIYNTIEKVCYEKPEFVWHIGGQSVLADLLGEVTTLVSMPCTDGYAISEASIMVSYMQVDSDMIQKMEKYNRMHHQHMIHIPSLMNMDHELEISQSLKKYASTDFGFPQNAFIIAVVGNRLDFELSDDFIQIMRSICEREKNIYFAFIGNCSRKWNTGVLKEKIIYLGFRKDLIEVLKITNLFLNPPRKGGGGGALYSLFVGVPVITLPNCDAANIGDMFVCESLEGIPDLVSRYYNDKKFYRSQVEKCKEIYEKYNTMDRCANIRNLIQDVRYYINKK